MRREDFKRPSGRVLRVGSGSAAYLAYVPAPLPPQLQWDSEFVGMISAADRALGRLAGVGQTLPNPHLLIGTFKRREAVLSSRIEGTRASLGDLLMFEAAPTSAHSLPDVREVWNYVRALDYALERLATLPLSKRLFCEMHAKLMKGVRGDVSTPGEFRRSQNWIGPPGSTLASATYVPPPPDEMHTALDALERFLHGSGDIPALVRIALVHYQFEAIHPFLDGNGRIGRLLITLLLCVENILPGPYLYLSAYFERNRREYYQRLLGVSQRGEWHEWLMYFLRGVENEADDAVQRAGALLRLRDLYHEQLRGDRSAPRLLRLVDHLFAAPAITVAGAVEILAVTPRAARGNIMKLVEAGILREITGAKRNRAFVADEILRINDENGERG